jgi:hypothetical protein
VKDLRQRAVPDATGPLYSLPINERFPYLLATAYRGVDMAAARALDRRARVLLEHLSAGAAPVVLRDRRQHLRELPGLAVGLEFLRRDQIAGLVDVTLEQSVNHR